MVNTFLPYPNFKRSVGVLDWRRLGKQRAEAKQILKALRGDYDDTGAWINHPAVLMWEGFEGPLCIYGINACSEWVKRGYKDNTIGWFLDMAHEYETCIEPWWMGLEDFHRSHQSNLIRKDPAHYVELWPGVPPDLPYYWPKPEEQIL